MCERLVVETSVTSCTGKFLYSDMFFEAGKLQRDENGKIVKVEQKAKAHYHGILNKLVKYPVIGILAAVTRFALSIIHTLGHSLAAIFTCKKGHLFHATKGLCEALRCSIEIIPIFGRIFAFLYSFEPGSDKDYLLPDNTHMYEKNDSRWWIMKIYNPSDPDLIDKKNHLWTTRIDGINTYHYIKA